MVAIREILKYPSVERITLVDLDPEMTKLSSRFPLLAQLNGRAFRDPRVQVVNEDAFIWVEETKEPAYDAAIIDFLIRTHSLLGSCTRRVSTVS